MPIYKQTTEITNIDDIWTGVDRDIVEIYFGDKNVFTVWQTYEGTLPATINANGADMRQYHVYGATGGVGDRTVQLFDKSTIALYPFKSDGSLFPASTGVGWVHSDYIECQPGETYTAYGMSQGGANTYHCIYDENQTFVRSVLVVANQNAEITFASGEKYIRLSVRDSTAAHEVKTAMFFRGTIPPETYVPYGYKLDMGVSDGTNVTTTPIYIGDDPLEKDEYVDYRARKIYRINNLWNITAEDFEDSSIVLGAAKGYIISGLKPNTNYTLSSNIPRKTDAANLWFNGGSTVNNGVWDGNSRTSTSDKTGEVIVYYRETELTNYEEYWYQLVETLNPYLPTDPPVPLPALPTCEGTTIVDYAGSGTAPEKVIMKYRKENF